MEKSWFEMNILRRNRLNNAVWIPLYACQELERRGQIGYDGYKAEFFGCGTLAVPTDEKKKAAKMGWDSVGIGYDSKPRINEEGKYLSSDVCTYSPPLSVHRNLWHFLRISHNESVSLIM